MNIYQRKFRWKVILLGLALIITAFTLWYNNGIAKQIAVEEQNKMKLWAQSQALLPVLIPEEKSFPLVQQIVIGNNTIPIIMVNEDEEIIGNRNFDSLEVLRGWNVDEKTKDLKENRFLKKQYEEIKLSGNNIIEIDTIVEMLRDDGSIYPYELKQKYAYKDSNLLSQLKYYTLIQLTTIGAFLLLSYLAFSAARRSEQNQVWVGMAKETAHQLGTPLSSLVGWIEIIKANEETTGNKDNIGVELEKDLDRLKLITDRFSKIGSKPKLEPINLNKEIKTTVDYMKRRASTKIKFETINNTSTEAHLSPPLFDWVIENILKNALDAMQSSGEIVVTLSENGSSHIVDIYNSGQPLPKSKWKTIFQPGYSTKKRGWGLGLSLSKRIIEKYHKGKITVKSSDGKVGTTFRIVLPKLNIKK